MRVATIVLFVLALVGSVVIAAQEPQSDVGVPVTDETTKATCSGCHKVDDKGRMTRISYIRTTPEGWQTIIKRMVRNNGLQIDPLKARAIVKYLSNNHGLTPAEARVGFYEVERRSVIERVPNELDQTCRRCHSVGRILSQRRTREDWQLLANMHVAVFPLSEGQGNFVNNPNPPNPIIVPTVPDINRESDGPRPGPIPTAPPEMSNAGGGGQRGGGGGGGGGAADPNGGLDRALDYLNRNLGLASPQWGAWRANFRYPRLEGSWIVETYLPGKGRGFGQMTIEREQAEDEYRTRTTIEFSDGEKTTRTGKVLLYAGYSWRGTSNDAEARNANIKELREVMLLSDDMEAMRGRWFSGAYDEYGMDVQVRRVGRDTLVSATDRTRLLVGRTTTVKVYGANFPNDLRVADVDFGPGTTASNLRTTSSMLTVDVAVKADAVPGMRDLIIRGKVARQALAIFDRIDYIRVLPEQGMARLGGVTFPKQFQQFDAVAYHSGADKRPNTADDIELGPVPVTWSIEEFPVTINDDDVRYVGTLDARGFFTPNVEGPNPERSGNRNNFGDVRVVGTYSGEGTTKALKGTSHLIVTVPLYVRWAQMEIFRD
jgi:quinohemoprotein amine dehydrogenase